MNKKVEKNKMRIGFDNEKYLKMQSEHIRNRIGKFGNKLYLEFGGKLFDDYHASRVLPGFAPDSKLRLLKELSSQAEIVIVISAKDIEKNKIRGDLGITYDTDVLRLIQTYKDQGLYVGSVTITQFSGQESALLFKNRLEKLHIPVYLHYLIPGYPSNIPLIISDEGYGKNDYIKTSRPLVIVTAPGPGSGKMAACLSQLYHEHKRGVLAGYAKFETFPIWNLPLKHPVNLAYEAATADLNDINMIDPFHLAGITVTDRKVVIKALERAKETDGPAAALELRDGRIITGKTTNLLGASAALLLNVLKVLAGIDHETHIISPESIEPIQKLKVDYLKSKNPRLHTDEVLIALSASAATNPQARLALSQLPELAGCQAHTSVMLSDVDIKIFKKLEVQLTSEAVYEHAL